MLIDCIYKVCIRILLKFNQDYVIFICIILTKTCKILHYWYQNICMFSVAYFIAVYFKEML